MITDGPLVSLVLDALGSIGAPSWALPGESRLELLARQAEWLYERTRGLAPAATDSAPVE